MDLEQENDIRCMLSSDNCEYRIMRKECFGYQGSVKCPHREELRREFEQHLADIENAKYAKEYPT